MHCVQFIKVTDGELAQTRLRLLLNQVTEVLLGVLALLNLRLQYFLQLMDFFECLCIPLLLLVSLL